MKRIVSTVLVIASAILIPSIAFAQNTGSTTQPQALSGPGQPGRPDDPRGPFPKFLEGGEAKTLNGTVAIKGRAVTIAVAGKTYQLVSPPSIFEDIKLTDGTSVSLEGQLYTTVTDPWVKSDGVVFVRTITFGGQTYDLVALAEKKRAEMPQDMGRGHGPMGGQQSQGSPQPKR